LPSWGLEAGSVNRCLEPLRLAEEEVHVP